MAKRKRLLWEIKEGERQEKELAELGRMLEKLTIPLAQVLEGVREKAKRAGIQLPLSQDRSRPNSPSCSPSPAAPQHQKQLRPPPPNSAQLQTPTTMRPRQQGYSFSPSVVKPIQPLNRSPVAMHQQHHHHHQQQQRSSINASPLSTTPLMMSKCATPASTVIPGNTDPRVTANLMTQSQLQNWSQSHAAQQQQLRQSPAGTGVAMGSVIMTPTQPAAGLGPHHSIMHNNTVASRPGIGQHNMHPLNSVRSMHTPSAIGGSSNHGGVGDRAQAVAAGRSTQTCSMPLTMVPGSVLSQAASR